MNGTRQRNTGGQERSVVDDIRDVDPASWPYAGQVPPAQVALQEARRRQAQPGPQRVPTFTPTGPQQRLSVTGAQPQAPAQQPLQARQHPAGTFTASSPWDEWLRRAQVRPYPYPHPETPAYNGTLRARAGHMADTAPAQEPFTLAPPLHESWRACQALMMLPLPGCDIDSYLQAVSRLTGTRGCPRLPGQASDGRVTVAALPASGADYSDWAQRAALAAGIADATRRVAVTRPGKARAYRRLREAVTAAWDYGTAERLVRNAADAGLIDRDDAQAWGAR